MSLHLRPVALGLALTHAAGGCTCNRPSTGTDTPEASVAAPVSSSGASVALSPPLAASVLEGGEVLVAALDAASHGIRVQRLDAKDAVVGDRLVVTDVKSSTDAEMRLFASKRGTALTWRGERGGKLVRELFTLDADLRRVGDATPFSASTCATHDGVWFVDAKGVQGRPWGGAATTHALPKDREVTLSCGAHRPFVLVDEDESVALLPIGGPAATKPAALMRDADFGEDEQRERAEFTVGDELGVVRLSVGGALALREVKADAMGPLHRLKFTLPREADIVAVDASARAVFILFGEDTAEGCPASPTGPSPSTKVTLLRVDRATLEESTVEIAPAACGRELGPFFTGAAGDGVVVSWVERVSVVGQPRASIRALSYRVLLPVGALPPLGRIDLDAEALVDGGCDAGRCVALALVKAPVGSTLRVLHFPPL